MEAMIDLRNLLAQGYVPVLGQDGQTVYLVDPPAPSAAALPSPSKPSPQLQP